MDAVDVLSFHDCLMVHLCNDLKAPNGITKDLINKLVHFHDWSDAYIYSYPNITYRAQIGIGFLLQEIYDVMQTSLANTTSYPNFALFSGHDTSILPILVSYGLQSTNNPQAVAYSSHLVFETYQDNEGVGYVRFIYNSQEYLIPGCDGVLCSFDIFAKITEELLPRDIETTCAL